MALKRISPEAADELMRHNGYSYVDVRSIPEFEQGHPTGAYNVPLIHRTAAGNDPNPDFLAVMEKSFPKDAKLIIGCAAGGRSLRAAQMLLEAGYTSIVEQYAGFSGGANPDTGRREAGWQQKRLPVSANPESGHAYDELVQKET